MRWRVLALVVVPTVAALALGGLRISAAQGTSATASRTAQLGVVGTDITALAEALEDERDLTAGYVAVRQAGGQKLAMVTSAALKKQYAVTDARMADVRRVAGQVNGAYPGAARTDLSLALGSLSALPELRALANSEISALPLVVHYSSVVAPLVAFNNDIAAGSSSAMLAQTVTSIEALTQAQEQTSQLRAVLFAALIGGRFELGALGAFTGAQSSAASALATFQQVGPNLTAYVPGEGFQQFSEAQQYNDTVTGADNDAALAAESDAVQVGGTQALTTDPQADAQAWFTNVSFTIKAMRTVLGNNLGSAVAQAGSLQQGAANSAKLTGLVVLILLLLVLFITIVIARSMILPLRRLRADALDVADRRLPDMVRRLSESDGGDESVRLEPIGIDSTDEIGEVARAFDQVHSEAARLAGDEAMLRANLNAMFVNLSRRSQTLIERQLGIIESLEQSEQDSGRLNSLFRLDHLATRMRRNSENLLVLAGHEAPRKWTQPVPLVDVVRAAVSEIEQYERITLNVQSGLVIAGRAASDVVHLVAELVENATTFSRKDTQVMVSGQMLSSGGVLVEITDSGLGIPEQELAYANWRLDNPPVIDVAVSRRMGLFVVGRLAARHGIRVRLRPAQGSGLSALIWVPEAVAEVEAAPPMGARRRFGSSTGGQPVLPAAAGPGAPAAGGGPAMTRLSGASMAPGAPPAAKAMTAAEGRAAALSKSIWFDTESEDEPADAGVPAVGQAHSAVDQAPGTFGADAFGGTPAAGALPVRPAQAGRAIKQPQGAQVAQAQQAAQAAEGGAAGPPRLPIYDSIESEWFRRGGQSAGGTEAPGRSWSTAADEGFRAAQTVVSPVAEQNTSAGLPKRVPSANLVPGSIAGKPSERRGGPGPAAAERPVRSPEAVRARMSAFQTRGRDGRGPAPQPPGNG